MKNLEIAKIFYEISEMLEMQGVQFKPVAYRNAAMAIESLSEDIEDIYKRGGLKDIPGVGEHIALKITELLKTGKLQYYEELKKKMPMKVDELMQIHGLGPKRIMLLYEKLGIKNIKDLQKAAEQHKIQKISSLGEKVEQEIVKGIEFAKKKTGRFTLGYMEPIAEHIKNELKKIKSVNQIEIAGSYRRRKETIGDIDILVTSSKPQEVMNYFLRMKDISEVLAKGTTKSMVRLGNGLEADLRVLKDSEYGSALLYFTGNKQHNIELRKIALKKGYTLSEYGLFKLKGKKLVAGRTEAEIYKKLGLDYIEPEMRENLGEIDAAMKHRLPKLVTRGDIKGDLHVHSNWSEGNDEIEAMALAAQKAGLKFVAMTDHVGTIGITNPLDETRLAKQAKAIDKLNKKLGIKILKGAEVDILPNGRLALSRKAQDKLDIVLASIHSGFNMSEKDMTSRIVSAMQNDRVHIFAHPTGRLLGEREAYALNFAELFDAARENSVFLEINCHPMRMDLDGERVKAALDRGCRFSIGTDSHSKDAFGHLSLGADIARRGWLQGKDLLNTLSYEKLMKLLESK